MTVDFTLWLALAAALVAAALGLVRSPARRVWDWWLALAGVLSLTALTFRLRPAWGAPVGCVLYAALVLAPWLLVRSAWQKASRGDPQGALARARAVRWLHPLGESRRLTALVDLAVRTDAGEPVDLAAAMAALDVPAGMERTLSMLALTAWRCDFTGAASLLEDVTVRREAVRRGQGAVVLAAAGEREGPEGVARAWEELVTLDPAPAASSQAAGVMLVAAAHLGAVAECQALLRELSRQVPPARAAYWLATAEQRAGDVVSAHATLTAAVAAPGISRGALRRLEHRMMHPVEAVTVPPTPAVAAVLAAVQSRVAARRALAGLRWTAGRPSPVTWSLAVILAGVFGCELLAGLGDAAGDTLYRMGGLPVPLPSAVAGVRVLTYGLVHAGWAHLAVNLLTLVFFGRFVEQRLGGLRLMAVYVLAGVVGGAAALAGTASGTLVVGASGSIFGLVGAAVGQIVADPALRSTPEGRSELMLLGALLLVQAGGDALTPHVSSAAHVGGVAAGLVAGLVLRQRRDGIPENLVGPG